MAEDDCKESDANQIKVRNRITIEQIRGNLASYITWQ